MLNECEMDGALQHTSASSSSAPPRAASLRQTSTESAACPAKVSEKEWKTMVATVNDVVGIQMEPSPRTTIANLRNEKPDALDRRTLDAEDYYSPADVPIAGNTTVLGGYLEEADGE